MGESLYRPGRVPANRKPLNPKSRAIADRHRAGAEKRWCREVTARVDRRGYAVACFAYGDSDLYYSIGFPRSLGQGDVVVAETPADDRSQPLAYDMIDALFRQCQAGLRMADGLEVPGLIAGHACVLRSVHRVYYTAELFADATRLALCEGEPSVLEAFQIVWPSAINGRLPWEDGADLIDLQPALYEPRQVS